MEKINGKKRPTRRIDYSEIKDILFYINNIKKYPLLTPKQETEYGTQIRQVDDSPEFEQTQEYQVAYEKLITSNLRLVVKIAHDFRGLGLPLADLIAEGNKGLMRATEKFNPNKGAKFSSYSAWWIKQSMRRALANQSRTIRIPIQMASKISKIESAKIKLSGKSGHKPTLKELSEYTKFEEKDIKEYLRFGNIRAQSIHTPLQKNSPWNSPILQEVLEDTALEDTSRLSKEQKQEVLKALDILDERERLILKYRFGLDGEKPKTLEEIAKKYIHKTRERVRQIQNQALNKLKNHLEQIVY